VGTERKTLGYVIVTKPWRKGGNGPIGSGRKGGTGKRCTLYKIEADGSRIYVDSEEGPTATATLKLLRLRQRIIPTYVAIKGHGETFF
jgi:hypothetical protein